MSDGRIAVWAAAVGRCHVAADAAVLPKREHFMQSMTSTKTLYHITQVDDLYSPAAEVGRRYASQPALARFSTSSAPGSPEFVLMAPSVTGSVQAGAGACTNMMSLLGACARSLSEKCECNQQSAAGGRQMQGAAPPVSLLVCRHVCLHTLLMRSYIDLQRPTALSAALALAV